MIFNKTIRSRYFRSLLILQSSSNCSKNHLLASQISTISSQFSLRPSIFLRPFSDSAQFAKMAEEKIGKFAEPLSVFFRTDVGAPHKSENSDFHTTGDSENAILRDSEEEVRSLKDKLRNLEKEIRNFNEKRPEKGKKLKPSSEKVDLNGRKGTKGSLSALFSNKKTKEVKVVERTDFGHENPIVYKELSSDMQMFALHLYVHGYFKNANFIPKNWFDVTCFEVSYAREFLKFAAVSFGKDHEQIAKWLSAKDLKKVALFGCPSLAQKSVYAAKQMRRYFKIDEQKVCQKCVVKESCEHANKRSNKASTKLFMANVSRVLIMYAMESVPQKLVVPEEIKDSVSRLLKEIVSLTEGSP